MSIKNIKKIVKLFVFTFIVGGTAQLIEPVYAGPIVIATEPLATSTGLSIKPNLLVILDDSGSMANNYGPDQAGEAQVCHNEVPGGANYGMDYCSLGDPPFGASSFNTMLYNPTIRYVPAKFYDATSFPVPTPTNAIILPFSLYTSGSPPPRTVNLTTGYPEAYWCQNVTDIPSPTNTIGTTPSCVKIAIGGGYTYPNATFKYKKMNAFWCQNATDDPLVNPSNCFEFHKAYGIFDPSYSSKHWWYNSSYSYLKTTTSTAANYYNTITPPQWCQFNTTFLNYTNCQVKKDSTHTYPKFLSGATVAGVQATASFRPTSSSTRAGSITSITANGVQLISSNIPVAKGASTSTILTAVINAINANTTTTSFTASSSSGNTVIVTAPYGVTSSNNTFFNGKTFSVIVTNITISGKTSTFTGAVDYLPPSSGNYSKVEIVPTTTSYTKAAGRSDCAGPSCTYAEELQNFATWFTYYKTRMDMVKSSESRVFSQVSDTYPGSGFRVGFRVISKLTSKEIQIKDFTLANKQAFFNTNFSILPSGSTPLRSALAAAGRLYAGKYSYDPVQASCQQNFTILSTDGYWNTYSETATYGPFDMSGGVGTNVGDTDGTLALPYRDALAQSDTLADIASYYWQTDLRPSMVNNVPTSNRDKANWQHMTTFTLGLGLDGLLQYAPNYEVGGSADYNNLLNGVAGYSWGDPINNQSDSRVDDLWHAAVNGHGLYFSASNPNDVVSSLTTAIIEAASVTGGGAAAATSNLEPVAGDNFAYTASYTTKEWSGNLEARTIDLTTGQLASVASWSAQALLDTNAAAGTRVLYGIDNAASTTDKKYPLTFTNVQAKGFDTYFDPAQLSQCTGTFATCLGQTRNNLFDFLMGKDAANPNASYRSRAHVLGDIVNSQPVYVGVPQFSYADAGYAAFAATNSTRSSLVYVGANDGFIHAFNAVTGDEAWAIATGETLKKMYKIADISYDNNHQYFTDGKLTVGDVYDGTNWKTILAGGLNAGGKSYYAVDITNPAVPVALWEYTDPEIGFTYGNPIITKLSNGTWVVVVTTGYNNGNAGKLVILNANTGALIYKISTGSANNSGLAKISNFILDSSTDNTTASIYGGDLDGNLYKFTLGTASGTSTKIATVGLPMTTKPALTRLADNTPVLSVATGMFLQIVDKTDITPQYVFNMKDNGVLLTNIIGNTNFVTQTITNLSSGTQRTVTTNPVDYSVKQGWYAALPDVGERVNVDPKIQLGTLVIVSNVPSAVPAQCTSGGYAWVNYFDVLTGSFIQNTSSNPNKVVSDKIGNALAVGVNVIKLPSGKMISITTTSDNQHPINDIPVSTINLPVKKVSWRELIPF